MKHLLALMFVTCVTFLCQAQPVPVTGKPNIDAKEIKKLIGNNKIADALHIIHFYTRNAKGKIIMDPDSIITQIKANALLFSLLPDSSKTDLTRQKRINLFTRSFGSGAGAGVQGGLGSIFPASTVADGLGTFIAERFKEELTMRYLENFRRKILEGDSQYFYSKLLPKTFDALQNYPNVFDYKAFLTVLREAFKDDLDHVGQNILPFLDDNMTQAKLNTPEFYISIATFDLFVNKIPQAPNALQAIAEWNRNKYMTKVGNDVMAKKILVLMSLLTETLQNNQGYLDSKADLNAFLKDFEDIQYAQIFMGLFVQKNYFVLNEISFSGKSVIMIINENFQRFHGLANRIGDIQITLNDYLGLSAEERKDVLPLLTSLNTNLQNVVNELAVFVPDSELKQVKEALRFSEHFFAATKLAKEEKYGLVIVEVLKTIDETKLREKNPLLYETINTYGLFIANVAQAKSGQEVKEALDVAALPVGSYKIKRNALSDISLNAFPGISFGYEFRSGINQVPDKDVKDKVASFAFSAPVGLAFSWGTVKEKTTKYKIGTKRSTFNENEFMIKETVDGDMITRTTKYVTGVSHSLFISVIDIGAVTSFRLTDEDTEELPEFTWANILAPGVFYFIGLKNTPLSIGIGAQYGPQLRTVSASDIKVSDSLITARILLSVDVPVFSFFSRTGVKGKNQTDSKAFYK